METPNHLGHRKGSLIQMVNDRKRSPKVLKLPLNLKTSYHSGPRRRENIPDRAARANAQRSEEHGTFRELAIPS